MNQHPSIIPGIRNGDIRELALRRTLYNGIVKPDDKLLYLSNPEAARNNSKKTKFLFELLDESAYIEGDLIYPYNTINIVPHLFCYIDNIMNNDKIDTNDINEALILSLKINTNNLSLYLIELGADLSNIKVKQAINEYIETSYDDSMFVFSKKLKEKEKSYHK